MNTGIKHVGKESIGESGELQCRVHVAMTAEKGTVTCEFPSVKQLEGGSADELPRKKEGTPYGGKSFRNESPWQADDNRIA